MDGALFNVVTVMFKVEIGKKGNCVDMLKQLLIHGKISFKYVKYIIINNKNNNLIQNLKLKVNDFSDFNNIDKSYRKEGNFKHGLLNGKGDIINQ